MSNDISRNNKYDISNTQDNNNDDNDDFDDDE